MSMYCEETGKDNASTVVLLHGGGMAGWMWQKQIEALGDYHMLVPDLPDHGKSLDAGPIDIADSAERVAKLIQGRAHTGRAHLVGHSLGGKIIVQMLATCPEVIDRAVVGSALFRPMPLLNLTLNMPMYKLTVWMLKNKSMLDMQARQFNFPSEEMRESFKREALAATPELLDRVYTQLNKYVRLPAGLEKAQVPTLVVAGEREPKAMRISASDIVNALPDAKGALIKGALHNYPWVKYGTFNAAVRSWLEGEESLCPGLLPL